MSASKIPLIPAVAALALLQLPLSPAQAGREAGNGGDPLALEFQSYAQDAATRFKSILTSAGVDVARVSDLASSAQVLIVDTTLNVTAGDLQQQSAAENFPDQSQIVVNRAAWTAITDQNLKAALALHEVLSLAGYESTGKYSISESCYEASKVPPLDDSKMIQMITSPEDGRTNQFLAAIEENGDLSGVSLIVEHMVGEGSGRIATFRLDIDSLKMPQIACGPQRNDGISFPTIRYVSASLKEKDSHDHFELSLTTCEGTSPNYVNRHVKCSLNLPDPPVYSGDNPSLADWQCSKPTP